MSLADAQRSRAFAARNGLCSLPWLFPENTSCMSDAGVVPEFDTWVPYVRDNVSRPVMGVLLLIAVALGFIYARDQMQSAAFYLGIIIVGNAVLWKIEDWTAKRDRTAREARIRQPPAGASIRGTQCRADGGSGTACTLTRRRSKAKKSESGGASQVDASRQRATKSVSMVAAAMWRSVAGNGNLAITVH